MASLAKILASKHLGWIICLLPITHLVSSFFLQTYGANPVEFYLLESGKMALYLFLCVSYISPLASLPRLNKPFSAMKKQRRFIGVACFVYSVLHVTVYLLDQGEPAIILSNLEKPFILIGLAAFLILLALALTSNNWAVRALGRKRWQLLHRLAYIAACLLILHIVAKDKGSYNRAIALFLPLAVLQAWRLGNYLLKSTKQG